MSVIYTVGHWIHEQEVFTKILKLHGINALADVRSYPGSRRSPQFGDQKMAQWLPAAGIAYNPWKELGGRKRKMPDRTESNAGWENESFRNYADYTETEDFQTDLDLFQAWSVTRRVALMCGEPHPSRCHRIIISENLVARGDTVLHILPDGTLTEHVSGLWGAEPRIEHGKVTYPLLVPQNTLEGINV